MTATRSLTYLRNQLVSILVQKRHPVLTLTFDFTECARTKSVTKQIVPYLNLVSTT